MVDIHPTTRVILVIVTMDGCPACEEYKPVFAEVATRYQNAPGLQIIDLDANDPDPEVQRWMNQHKVEGVPCVLVMRRNELGGGVWKSEGTQDRAFTEQTFAFAAQQAR